MQNSRARLRLRYRKDDVLRYIGHRDLLRLVIKLLRRAEAPYALSEGFSPKPRLTFGPALPLGVLADNELLDFELKDGVLPDAVELDALRLRLAAAAEPRDFVVDLRLLGGEERPISRVAVASRYVVEDPVARDLLRAALDGGSLPVRDEKKGEQEYAPRITAHRIVDGALELEGLNGENALNVMVLARWVAQQTPQGYLPAFRRKCLLDAAGNEL